MTAASPNFSPFPFDRLRRLSRRDAAIESSLARWFAPGRLGSKVAALVGGVARARLVGVVAHAPDPHAALAEVRHGGQTITVAGSSRPVRALAQRLLGGPVELDAPRPLTVVEQAIWALAVAAALADLGVAAEVWPLAGDAAGAGSRDDRSDGRADATRDGSPPGPGDGHRRHALGEDRITVAFTVELPPSFGPPSLTSMTVTVGCSPEILLRAAPPRPPHSWRLELPILVGRCALPRAELCRLAVRDVITLERCLELGIGAGGIGLAAAQGAVEARVATEYVPRDMALLDDAMLEVTVQLGTIRLSLRQLGELAIGQIVPLGRPLAGPYEIRAAGRAVGHGELVDIDGELGVRIVSIADQPDQE
ncbi:MAG TPA: FliM/FliN family flagellar motor switch protein [Kofleriaceae bacterium]|nr:FliM/FliN family flagellar motor switch protein [Kofleriaceae bacterium]